MSIVGRGLGLAPTVPIVTGGVGAVQLVVIVPGEPAKLVLSISALAQLKPLTEEAVVLQVTESLTATLNLDEEVHTLVLSEEALTTLTVTEEPLAVLTPTDTDC